MCVCVCVYVKQGDTSRRNAANGTATDATCDPKGQGSRLTFILPEAPGSE